MNLTIALLDASTPGFFEKIVEIWEKYSSLFLQGALSTMQIAILSTVIGSLIGLIIGSIRTIPMPQKSNIIRKSIQKLINFLLTLYIEVFRGTPMMVQALMIFYGYAYITGIQMNRLFASFLIVSINTGAYMSEIVRGGIESIDKGQFEGAQAIGMSHIQTMLKVILPQTIKNILPATGNEFVINIKDTSVLNVIAITELFYQTKTVASTTYAAFPVYTIGALVYLVLTFSTSKILKLFEKKMAGAKSYKMVEHESPNAKTRGDVAG